MPKINDNNVLRSRKATLLDKYLTQTKNLFDKLQFFSDTDNFELLDQGLNLAILGLYN